ncbi:hypothetical protein ACHMW6_23505 [Pseudoduganella sp. UC29_106]|uniref:hypothetical protein n=1 Tax=Pseudoduganella sp. UC29_106 TaxID=3374553 RepID=UPI0037572ADC
MRAYLAIACGLPVLLAGATGALNYSVDPYLLHQWDSPKLERLGPHIEKLTAWGKVYALSRYQPQVLYVGNSRTEVGLPVDAPQFAGRRVFNGALSGANLGDEIKIVRYASNVGPLTTVVWGLDLPSFTLAVGNTDVDDALAGGGPAYMWRRSARDLKRSISLDMTQDSLLMLAGQYPGVCAHSLSRNGQKDHNCVRMAVVRNGGTSGSVLPRTADFLRLYGSGHAAMPAFMQVLEDLCSSRLRLYVNPTHAITIDALYRMGRGREMEEWLRALAATAAQLRARGCDTRVYDFSGFNSVTTEPLPQTSGQPEMRYFWEPSHYRENVGRMVLARLEGGGEAADGFGAELLPERMDDHLARLRTALWRYRDDHPRDSALAGAASARASR